MNHQKGCRMKATVKRKKVDKQTKTCVVFCCADANKVSCAYQAKFSLEPVTQHKEAVK